MKKKGILALLLSLATAVAFAFGITSAGATAGDDVVACLFSGSTQAHVPGGTFDPIDSPGDDAQDIDGPGNAGDPNADVAYGVFLPNGTHQPANIPTGLSPDPLTDVEPGGYTFATDVTDPVGTQCLHVDQDEAQTASDDTDVYPSWISAVGTYDNIVCGTGSTFGRARLTASEVAADPGTPAAPGSIGSRSSHGLLGHASGDTNSEIDPNADMSTGVVTDYDIMFVGGNGALSFYDADAIEADNRPAWGTGFVHIVPVPRGPSGIGCVTTAVTDFSVNGSFIGTVTE